MKEKYIEQQISNKLNSLYETKEKFKKDELISFIAFMGFSIVGLTTIFFIPNVGLAAGAMAGVIACHKYKNFKKNDSEERKLNQEIKHLKKLKDKSIMNEKIKDKKITKLLALAQSQKSTENKYDNANILTGISNAITTIGAAATLMNPINIWIPLLGIGTNILMSKYEINKYRTKQLLENRVDNLIFDLDVEKINETNKKETKENINNKVVQTNNNFVKEKEKQKVYIKNRG